LTKNKKNKAIVSVINDLVTDQRVHKTCVLLSQNGYEVTLVGRLKRDSLPLNTRIYKTKRMKLLFEKGVALYVEFQIRLFIYLLFKPKKLLVSNDLDTLLPNYLIKKLVGVHLIYDSHEIFCEVPELQNTPRKKKIWEGLEKWILPKLAHCITVNDSIADWFNTKYKVDFLVVRNIPDVPAIEITKTREELNLPLDKKIILMQGAGINIQRGAEETVEAMKYIEDALFLIIGGGDVIDTLKKMVTELNLQDKVWFKSKMSASELIHYTRNADIGLTIDKDNNINYHFSLPNKLFDYIHAQVPILASSLPEIKNIITKYNIGFFIQNHQPKHIAECIQTMMYSKEYSTWKNNLIIAAEENNWQKEKSVWINLLKRIRKD
jgi:glycosyltransferase involved in cell wall biosynthesis